MPRNSTILPRFTPFTVLIDTREQHPFPFAGFANDSDKKYAPLIVHTRKATLHTGDYSILGYHDRLTVERKSKSDLFNCVGSDRDRFQREHERMYEMIWERDGAAIVVVEASLQSCFKHPPPESKLCPKVVLRTALSWGIRYGVHWWFCPTRTEAERMTLRFLQQFWRIEMEKEKEQKKREKQSH